ncbi:g3801 [Coccomyxa viridis]|uniref:G3801 protein n=1 Tax=Coccomyxa viridis TaxID=1274662 RepID=A0ABP1FNP1_9CHLO
MSFARGAARFAGRAARCAQSQHRAARAPGRSSGAAGVGQGRPHSTAQQTQRPALLRPKRDSLGRSFPGTRRPLITQLPAALQRSLAWQATLLFDWDGDEDG